MSKIKDLTDKRFGRLTVLRFVGINKHRAAERECLCDCGNKKITITSRLTSGSTKSCGCLHKETISKIKDLAGQKFGKLTVLKFVGQDKWNAAIWECLCECGTKKAVKGSNLILGFTQSCGCLQKEGASKTHLKDLKGQKFGRWTVFEEAGRAKGGGVLWLCKCQCGVEKIVTGANLVRGHSRSCGCYSRERAFETNSGEVRSGKNNFNWKGGVTPLYFAIRKCSESSSWRLDVFARDGFKCQHCDNKRKLNAHHKKPFAQIIEENNITTLDEARACEELWDINNGITLCEDCHKLEHKRIKNKELEMNTSLN